MVLLEFQTLRLSEPNGKGWSSSRLPARACQNECGFRQTPTKTTSMTRISAKNMECRVQNIETTCSVLCAACSARSLRHTAGNTPSPQLRFSVSDSREAPHICECIRICIWLCISIPISVSISIYIYIYIYIPLSLSLYIYIYIHTYIYIYIYIYMRKGHCGAQILTYLMLKYSVSPRRDATLQKMYCFIVGNTTFENKRFS